MRLRRGWLSIVALVAVSPASTASAQTSPDVSELIHRMGQFAAAIDPRIHSATGELMPAEQQRELLYKRLRAFGVSAVPAVQRGLIDADVQVRRNVALYLNLEGGNYANHAPEPLDLKPFLPQLAVALRDDDERVKELSAQALQHIGADAVIAVPDLLRLLAEPSKGLRNSACIGLAGIGPAARDALPALRRALADASVDVRQFARHAIDRIDVLRDERADAFAGCYHLQLGRWTRLWIFSATPDAGQIPPAAFQLDRSPVDPADPLWLQIRPNTIIDGEASRLDGWTLAPDGSNAIYITWTDGFTGVSLHLHPEGTRLRGKATAYTDAPGLLPFPSARAVAVRAACETMPPSKK